MFTIDPAIACNRETPPLEACANDVVGRQLRTLECNTIRLHDAWARYCRTVVFASASDQPLALDGTVIARAPGISSRDDVWPTLRRELRKAKLGGNYEPRWADATACEQAVDLLSLTNAARIKSALRYSDSPIESLRLLRNFFAHRCEGTGRKLPVVRTAINAPKTTAPEEIPGLNLGTGVVLDAWMRHMKVMAEAMVKSST